MATKQLAVVSSKHRQVVIEIDRHYVVKPQNKNKLKHRDRECIVLNVVAVSESHPKDIVVKVRFIDNNRQGRVDLEDLVPIGDLYENEYIKK